MNQSELAIIRKLSASSAEPSARFTGGLYDELLKREAMLNKTVMPTRRHTMSGKKLTMALVALLVIAGASVFMTAIWNKSQSQTAQSGQSQSTTQSSSLPNQQVQNLDEARKSLSFKPLLPTIQLNGEKLSAIKLGTKSNMLDDSDTLYLTYSDGKGTLYKIAESSKSYGDPTDTQKVDLVIQGKKISGSFYRIQQAPDSGSATSVGGDAAAPTSYMFWKQDGVRYEISEFGRIPKDQLIQLANSLKN